MKRLMAKAGHDEARALHNAGEEIAPRHIKCNSCLMGSRKIQD